MKRQLSLEHRVRPSVDLQGKPPVIFLLHGYGSNQEDLFSFASELPKEYTVISLQAPYALSDFGYAWYALDFSAQDGKWSDEEQAVRSRDSILQCVEEACQSYDLNSDDVTLLGFSQGAILSYALALSYPQKVRRVVALSGYIHESFLHKNFRENNFDRLQIYASHGSMDQVIPVAWARKIPPFLEELKIQNVYEEFPVGHTVCPQNFYAFRHWLEKTAR